ncbi:TRAP transporter small permease [Shumkonia mesophila]|uniref:TRAP transporter small permease n=1 Tax=Shumkonia mesophila TaxID=2838854 RepID=UPI002934F004|nr:TRAP transporter small permease [Shumkonia mesophila]
MNDDPQRADSPIIDLAGPLRIVVTLGFLAVLAVTLAQVFFRYVLGQPLIWSEELSRLLIVWVAFVGGAVVCWDGRHLNVDVAFNRFPRRLRDVVRIFNIVVALAFLGVLVHASIPIVRFENFQDMSVLPLPAGVVRLAATVGGALMAIAIVARALYRFRCERRRDPDFGLNDPM